MTTHDKYKRFRIATGILILFQIIFVALMIKYDPTMRYMKFELPVLFFSMIACIVLSNREATYRARLNASGPEEEHF